MERLIVEEENSILSEENNPSVIFEHKRIEIPFGSNDRERIILNHIRRLEEKINKLEKSEEKETVILYKISDPQATVQIKQFIEFQKKSGKTFTDDFEIMEKLHLPIEQVDLVLENLEKGGVVHERKEGTR